MNDEDIRITKERYSTRYQTFGYSPQTLGWGKHSRQSLRFTILTGVGDLDGKSILDVGCGFGDLYNFLAHQGWTGNYVGIDFVSDLIDEAQTRLPNVEFISGDFEDWDFKKPFDYVLASGIFNFKLKHEDNWIYIMRMLERMLSLASKGVAVDFMTSWVDYQKELNFHTDPITLIQNIRRLTKRFVIRQDYMPYEFSLYLYHDDNIKSDNTFNPI